jgi:hypothetical protein
MTKNFQKLMQEHQVDYVKEKKGKKHENYT